MVDFAWALETSKKITKQYDLCTPCLGRLFSKILSLSSPRLLGKKLRLAAHIPLCKKCYICRGLFDDLQHVHQMVLNHTSKYEFETFLLGVTMRPSVVDRDDFMRAKFQLIGAESVKSALARDLAKSLSSKTKTKLQTVRPDLSITVNLKTDSVQTRSKNAYISARYIKEKRGMPQKLPMCTECDGSGCIKCFGTRESIQTHISEYLCRIFDAKSATITWVGGEDGTSLVLNKGRPFFAHISDPKKRKPRMKNHPISEGNLVLFNFKNLKSLPTMPVKFHSVIEILIQTVGEIPTARLKQIKDLAGSSIAVYEKSRRNEKSVYSVKYRKKRPDLLSITLDVDGGLPVKKFITGETVFPNVTDMLGIACTCLHFDFHDVQVTQ